MRWIAACAFGLAGASALASSACADSGELLDPSDEIEGGALSPTEAGELDGGHVTDAIDADVPHRCFSGELCARTVDVPIRAEEHLTGLWAASPTDLWAAGSQMTILHYDGKSWERAPVAQGSKNRIFGIWGRHSNDIWLLDGVQILHTDGWKGANTRFESSGPLETEPPLLIAGWEGQPVTLRRRLIAWINSMDIWGSWGNGGPESATTALTYTGIIPMPLALAIGRESIWVVGQRGSAVRLVPARDGGVDAGGDAGSAWQVTQYDSLTSGALYGVWTSEHETWVVGDQGVRRFTTERPYLVPVEVPATESLHGIFGSSPSDLWIVGAGGCILHYDGVSWARIPSPTRADLHAGWALAPDDVWIVGQGTSLHVTREP